MSDDPLTPLGETLSDELSNEPKCVGEEYTCPECGNNTWYMGYDDWGESIHECTECGWVGTP